MSSFDIFTYGTCVVSYVFCCLVYYYGIVNCTFALTEKNITKSKLYAYVILIFLINFILFLFYSIIKLTLLTNWLLFLITLYFQCRYILKASKIQSAFISTEICLCTVTCVLLYRAVVSIIFNIPLNAFENILSNHKYLLVYWLSISYLSSGLIFIKFLGKKNIIAIKHLLSAWKQMKFFLAVNLILLIYIFIQAYFYDKIGDSFSEKIWAVFTCLYIYFGHILAFKFAIRTSYLYNLDKENIRMCNILNVQKNEEKYLSELIEKDELTNIFNRATGEKLVKDLIDKKIEFTLCVVDLDGLKYVNDNMGHKQGDDYIINIANILKHHIRHDRDILFRYGGDEFVIAFIGSKSLDIGRRMLLINNFILKKSQELSIPMQISYGYQSSDGFNDFESIFTQADKYMYQMKKLHKQLNPKIARIY